MATPKELYLSKCEAYQVRPAPAFADRLPATLDLVTSIDLNNATLGPKGIIPVVELVKVSPNLRSIDVSGNNLNSQSVQQLLQALQTHQKLERLVISNNQLPLAGEGVLELVKAKRTLADVAMENTHIRPLFQKLIEYQLKKNKKAVGMEMQRVTLDSSPDITANLGAFAFGGGAAEDDDDDDEDAEKSCDESDGQESQEDFDEEEEMRKRAVQANARRKTVSSEVISMKEMQNFQAKVVVKPDSDTEWLMRKLEDVHLFSHLEDTELKIAVDAMEVEQYSRCDVMLEEGEEGSRFIIIQNGEAEESKAGKTTRHLHAGDTVGETDLLYPSPHTCSVTVISEFLKGYWLDRSTYRHIITKSSQQKRERYMGFLQKVQFLKNMTHNEMLQLADALKTTKYQQGDVIIKFGTEGNWFHIITEGTVQVLGRKDGKEVPVCTFTVGECVGELEFINKHPCVADVVAATPVVRTAKMNRRHFEKVMGPVVDVLKRTADTSTVYTYYRDVRPS